MDCVPTEPLFRCFIHTSEDSHQTKYIITMYEIPNYPFDATTLFCWEFVNNIWEYVDIELGLYEAESIKELEIEDQQKHIEKLKNIFGYGKFGEISMIIINFWVEMETY